MSDYILRQVHAEVDTFNLKINFKDMIVNLSFKRLSSKASALLEIRKT